MLHVSPWFLTERGKDCRSPLTADSSAADILLCWQFWSSHTELTGLKWNHLKSLTPCGHVVIMHQRVISSFVKGDYCCLPFYRLIWFRQRYDVLVSSRCLVHCFSLTCLFCSLRLIQLDISTNVAVASYNLRSPFMYEHIHLKQFHCHCSHMSTCMTWMLDITSMVDNITNQNSQTFTSPSLISS